MSTKDKFLLSILSLFLLLSLGDNLSTYLCLTHSTGENITSEINPISAWMFSLIGILPWLAIQTGIKVTVVVYIYKLSIKSRSNYNRLTAAMVLVTLLVFAANVNNWWIYHDLLR